MYAEERQQTIAGLVADRGRVSVTALAEEFGVTTETVRRDLALLERAGMLRRVHGGAVPAGALTYVETALGERHGTRSEQKRKIASAALAFGGLGPMPWRNPAVEAALVGQAPSDAVFAAAADALLADVEAWAGSRASGPCSAS